MAEEAKKEKKAKKLSKAINGTVLTVVEAASNTTLNFDFNSLPKEIQAKLGPYGMSQKLGDAAAGKTGKDAVDSINKVWDGLMKNDWTVRAPAAKKATTEDGLVAKFATLPKPEQKKVYPALVALYPSIKDQLDQALAA